MAKTAMSDEKKRILTEAVHIREQLNSGIRHYQYYEGIEDNWIKELHYMDHDIKMLAFAKSELDAISDIYLLYAVACLGVTEMEGIKLFLSAVKNSTAGVTTMDVTNTDYLRSRLKYLTRIGMFFKFRYTVEIEDNGETKENSITLYTIVKDAQTFMNQKLGKKLAVHEWIQAKPAFELMGWSAGAYTAGVIAQSDRFLEFKQGVFATKAIGTTFIPAIVKLKLTDTEPVYVGVMSAFLHRLKGAQSENDYQDNCILLVNTIKQYLYSRDAKQQYARAVVVVEDNADLNEAAEWIVKSGRLEEDYDRIYFTGEGALKTIVDTKKAFLGIIKDTSKQGYTFIPQEPDFL